MQRAVERVNRYKPFRILIEITSGSAGFWDASGMREVKSFGILIEGYQGGVVDGD
jgi:hypothetical protein